MAKLTNLNLYGNDFSGPIPPELGSLSNLTLLWLGRNQLTGPIPSELGRLVNLESLHLQFNPLTGSLPQSLTQLSQLMRLDISNTAACAPADVAFQEWLATIDFRGESCTPTRTGRHGPAPGADRVGAGPRRVHGSLLQRPGRRSVDLRGRVQQRGRGHGFRIRRHRLAVPGAAGTARVTVTAQDPDGLNATQAMTVTTAASAGPQSDREVLEVFYDSTGRRELDEPHELEDVGPARRVAWGDDRPCRPGHGTGAPRKRVDGPDPGVVGEPDRPPVAAPRQERADRPHPSELGSLANLEYLDLGGNAVTGPIPDELGSLVNLGSLSLWGNALTGPIPAWLGNLTGLRWLDLGGNAVTGPIPAWLGNLGRLRWLFLGGNELTGPIPDELGSLRISCPWTSVGTR